MDQRHKFNVEVTNENGLHTRPATVIARLLQNCKSEVSFTYRGETINAKSVMNILLLAAGRHSTITVTVNGEDASITKRKILSVFADGFGETTYEKQRTSKIAEKRVAP